MTHIFFAKYRQDVLTRDLLRMHYINWHFTYLLSYFQHTHSSQIHQWIHTSNISWIE